MFIHELEWQRLDQPALSGMTTRQRWCTVQLYSPSVLRHEGRYRMWFVGNNSATRSGDTQLGCAESVDGLSWEMLSLRPAPTTHVAGCGSVLSRPRLVCGW